jgi:nitroreductase
MIHPFKERRTIRKYTSRNISAETLNELLETACRTATMGNLQLYSVVVTRNDEMKAKLAPAHFNQPMVTGAPVVLTFCADFNRVVKWCQARETTPGYDNALSFLNAATDALLLTQTFCNLAEEAGLGACFLGTTIYNPQQIIEILALPALVFPVATITVGYPDEEPAQTDRLPLEGIIHDEIYRDYTSERIDQLYQQRESLPENRKFVEINHKKTLAQVFAEIRYPKKDNETLSENLLAVLREQGFL